MKTLEVTKTDGKLFNSIVKGKNFMTPYLLGYYAIKGGEAELTKGSGFDNDPIYGVTVVQNRLKNDDLSKCCYSMDEALEYINSLQ